MFLFYVDPVVWWEFLPKTKGGQTNNNEIGRVAGLRENHGAGLGCAVHRMGNKQSGILLFYFASGGVFFFFFRLLHDLVLVERVGIFLGTGFGCSGSGSGLVRVVQGCRLQVACAGANDFPLLVFPPLSPKGVSFGRCCHCCFPFYYVSTPLPYLPTY